MKSGSLELQVVTITPARAREMLEQNTINRRLNKLTTERFASDMRGGDWQLNGEPIIVGEGGELLDGQHRLAACMRAAQPFETLLVRGVPAEHMKTIDSGVSRSFADVLTFEGMKHNVTLSGALKWLARYERLIERNLNQLPQIADHSREKLLEILQQNPGIIYSVERAMEWRKTTPAPRSVIGFVHYIAGRHAGVAQADSFFTQLATATAPPDSAITVVRNTLLNHQIGVARLNAFTQSAMLIKAFRYWNAGKTPKRITLKRGRTQKEAFPRIEDPLS